MNTRMIFTIQIRDARCSGGRRCVARHAWRHEVDNCSIMEATMHMSCHEQHVSPRYMRQYTCPMESQEQPAMSESLNIFFLWFYCTTWPPLLPFMPHFLQSWQGCKHVHQLLPTSFGFKHKYQQFFLKQKIPATSHWQPSPPVFKATFEKMMFQLFPFGGIFGMVYGIQFPRAYLSVSLKKGGAFIISSGPSYNGD